MKGYTTIFLFICLVSCEVSDIPISETLERYPNYVYQLNSSLKGDSISLMSLLKRNEFYDATGYEHGYTLVRILEKIGDSKFNETLRKLQSNEIAIVNMYIEVDLGDNYNLYEIKFPKTFKTLRCNILQ